MSSSEVSCGGRRPKWQWTRWGFLLLCGIVLRYVAGYWTTSPSETFWFCLPLVIGLAVILKLIPRPEINAQTRFGRIAVLVILATVPTVFYSTLTRLTDSRWSWWECVVATYYFSFCLELPLLYLFRVRKWCGNLLETRFPGWRGKACSGAVTLVLYLLLIPILLASLAVHRPKLLPRITETQFQAGTIQLIQFDSRGPHPLQLKGDFWPLPDSRGTVIVCHGVGANRRDISAITQLVHDCGYQVLSFDFRGHGESAGRTITYGANERLDVLGAYDYCLNRPDVDPEQIYALGVSMGGSSLLLALPDMPQVKAAMIDSAFADLPSMVDHQLRFFPELLRTPLHRVTGVMGRLETGYSIETIRPIDALPQISARLYFIHGTADFVVPARNSIRMHESLPGSQLHLEEEAPHIGTGILNPAVYRRILRMHFQPPPENPRKLAETQ